MKYIFILALSVLFSISGNSLNAQTCDQTLWNHVYNNYRLEVYDSCMSVTGHIHALVYEADGDIHVRVTVDTEYTHLLNTDNYTYESGCLVVEPVCATTITQPDAESACTGFSNTIPIPVTGEYVKCTGDYVIDNDHGWTEIHPVTSIVMYSTTGIQNTGVVNPDVTVFPNPANNLVNFKLSEKPSSPVNITIADELGRLAGNYQMLEMTSFKINSQYLPNGKYFYNVAQDGKSIGGGSFVIDHR